MIIYYCCLLLLLILLALVSEATALSSPWAPASWRFTLNVGREVGTYMPEAWGASGARLALPLEVTVTSDTLKGGDQDNVVGSGACALLVTGGTTFISSKGEESVDMSSGGGWKIEFPAGKTGRAARLTFWLDVKEEAQRNDVTLPAERIYFTANCWREQELDRGSRVIAPIVADYEQAQRLLKQKVAHDTGDRRLDGKDPIETLAAYKEMTELTLYRDEKLRLLREAERIYPKNPEKLPEGPWPGQEEWLSISPVYVAVKRKKMLGDEFHIIGSWKADPMGLDTDDYEEVEYS
jgi:hypothetical protein